jgi:fatty acid desaturase
MMRRMSSRERSRHLSFATLCEWALIAYGALLLIQIVLAFLLLVMFVWVSPANPH